MMKGFFLFLLLLCIFTIAHSHKPLKNQDESPITSFMSTSRMIILMKTEGQLVQELKHIIKNHEKKKDSSFLLYMREYITRYEKLESMGEDKMNIIYHPINSYNFIKKIIFGWARIKTACNNDEICRKEILDQLIKKREDWFYPELADLNVLAVALARLQDFYQLNISDMIQATIIDQTSNKTYQGVYTLDAWDCMVIGNGAEQVGLFGCAVDWKLAAKTLILNGDKSVGLETCEKALQVIIARHDELLIERGSKGPGWKTHDFPIDQNIYRKYKDKIEFGGKKFVTKLHSQIPLNDMHIQQEMLCRGQNIRPAEMDSHLQCHYFTNGDPYLKIGPFKVEHLSKEQPINVFHDFIYDSEIKRIQEIAIPKLNDSIYTFPNQDGSFSRFTGFQRISQHTMVGLNEDPTLVRRLIRRAEAAFNLKFSSVTEWFMKVINYGTGGHYAVHIDTGRDPQRPERKTLYLETGAMIATIMLHLSDVDAGGYTVFPVSGVTLLPKKGAATIWYNYNKAGEQERDTFHAGCPVLHGSKWIVTIRPRMFDQMFTRHKCGMDKVDQHPLYGQ